MKEFDTLLKSEKMKAERFANTALNVNDCKITGYSTNGRVDELGFVKVICEICHNYEERADIDVQLNVFMPDRRRSFASSVIR